MTTVKDLVNFRNRNILNKSNLITSGVFVIKIAKFRIETDKLIVFIKFEYMRIIMIFIYTLSILYTIDTQNK